MSVAAHAVHVLMLLVGLAGLAALLGPQAALRHRAARLRRLADRDALVAAATARAATPSLPPAALPAAAASVGAGWVHAAVAGPGFGTSAVVGGFFLGAACLQTAWAAAVTTRPSTRLLRIGLVGNAAVVALWATSRLVTLPFAGGPEPVGAWDLLATSYELAVVGCCLVALAGSAQTRRVSPRTRRGLLVASSVVTVALVAAGARP